MYILTETNNIWKSHNIILLFIFSNIATYKVKYYFVGERNICEKNIKKNFFPGEENWKCMDCALAIFLETSGR